MFVAEEKNKVREREKMVEDGERRLTELRTFIQQKNPLLLKEFADMKIREAQDKSDEIVKEVLQIGIQKN